MGSGRILGVGRLECSVGSRSRATHTHTWLSPFPPHLNLHLSIPAAIVEHHLLVEGLPAAVRRVHLGTGVGGWVRLCPPPVSLLPCSWLGSCLLQDALDEADQKGAGLGMELVIPCREGEGRMLGSRLGPKGRGAPEGAQVVALPPLTQHCVVQAHIDYGFEVQHAEVALWVMGVEYEPPPPALPTAWLPPQDPTLPLATPWSPHSQSHLRPS